MTIEMLGTISQNHKVADLKTKKSKFEKLIGSQKMINFA